MIFSFLLIFSRVYAAEILWVSLTPEEVTLWETFTLNIQLDVTDMNQDVIVDIPWIENFHIFSQSQWYSYTNINGEQQNISEYEIVLEPQATGIFSLWPVRLNFEDTILQDDTIFSVAVTDSTTPIDIQEDVSSRPHAWEESLRGLRFTSFPLVAILIALGLFVFGMYLVVSQILFPKNTMTEAPNPQHDTRPTSVDMLHQYFTSLKDQADTLSSQDFFRAYNTWLKKIWTTEWYRHFPTQTLTQMQQDTELVQHPLFSPTFENSYLYEFSTEDTSLETRKKYVSLILDYLS